MVKGLSRSLRNQVSRPCSQREYESHIEKVCRVAEAKLYVFRLSRDYLSFHSALTFFLHVNYCIYSHYSITTTAIGILVSLDNFKV